MASPTNTLVVPPSRMIAALEVGTLGMWVALEAYLVAFTAPPPIVIFLFSLPVPLFLWLVFALRKTTIFEVNATGIRQTRDGLLVTELPFQDVGSVEARYKALRALVLKVRDRNGKSRLTLVSGSALGVYDLRFLYRAIASRAADRGVPVSPNEGWPIESPPDSVRKARGDRFNVVAEFLVAGPMIMLVVGLVTLLVALLNRNWEVAGVSAAIAAIGAVLLARVKHYLETRRRWA